MKTLYKIFTITLKSLIFGTALLASKETVGIAVIGLSLTYLYTIGFFEGYFFLYNQTK